MWANFKHRTLSLVRMIEEESNQIYQEIDETDRSKTNYLQLFMYDANRMSTECQLQNSKGK